MADDVWWDNPGHCPEAAKGKRVRVMLVCGREASYDDNPMSPAGWTADGKGACRWSLKGHPFDIAQYRII